MKLLDVIKEQRLDEINMSPSNLKTIAATIDARAGMEFEMIVPGASQGDNDEYPEPDYDSDEGIRSIQDAYDFFYDGDYNGRRDVERLRDKMQEDYHGWLGEHVHDRWDSDMSEVIYRWLKENANAEDIAGILELEHNEDGEYPEPTKEDFAKAADKVIEDQISPWYEDAEDDFRDDFYSNADLESDWLEHEGIENMSDVESNYDINWPHYHSQESGISVDDVADEFSREIGRPVNASDRYHGGRREAGHYVVEPDSSLDPDDSSDGGLEFVSPPLPLDEMLSDLDKVVNWANNKGCYTNDSTGLHINVSVPDFSMEKLDYTKLALLLGDKYILEKFGRLGNTYCKSAVDIVKERIVQRPDDVAIILDKMKQGLATLAGKVIHSGATSKYTSINTKTGYIEFRSPGGDWLGEYAADEGNITNTLLRFVVALDAACDETKYKEEYAKKLYKLLTPSNDSTDTIQYFAKYSAGEMPQAALRSFVKQAQLQRKLKKGPTGTKYWWSVGRPGYGASVEVVATSKEEAIEKGRAEYPDWANATNITAKPVRPYDQADKTPRYEIYNKQTGNSVEDAEGITNDRDALTRLNDYIEHGPHNLQRGQASDMFGIRQVGGAPVAGGNFTGQWRVVDGLNREVYRFRGVGNSQTDANRIAALWARENNFDGNYEVYPVMA